MTRIIAGTARGRRLRVPRGSATRPTSDRAREALFSAVEAELDSLDGRSVLDLYAGSGAVGLEALSRGAATVVLVESARPALSVLAENVRAVGLPGVTVVPGTLPAILSSAPAAAAPFDWVFLDPPYAVAGPDVVTVLEALRPRWVTDGALVVVERATRARGFDWPDWIAPLRSRAYGEATFWYGRADLA